jgi:hypothetical protein
MTAITKQSPFLLHVVTHSITFSAAVLVQPPQISLAAAEHAPAIF